MRAIYVFIVYIISDEQFSHKRFFFFVGKKRIFSFEIINYGIRYLPVPTCE